MTSTVPMATVVVYVLLSFLYGFAYGFAVAYLITRQSTPKTKVKRYLLFIYDEEYPCGGWWDLKGSFGTLEGAESALHSTMPDYGSQDRAEIVDTVIGEPILNYNFFSRFDKNGKRDVGWSLDINQRIQYIRNARKRLSENGGGD